MLAPNLRPAQVVITDNLSAHKTERVRELVEQRGCELLYLPPYSPDLNPIEEAFSKIKGLLRKAEARNRETLVEVMGQVLSSTGSITMISAVWWLVITIESASASRSAQRNHKHPWR